MHHSDRRHEVISDVDLAEETACAGSKGLANERGIVICGYKQKFCVRRDLLDKRSGLKPVQLGNAYIEENHIGLARLRFPHRFIRARCFRNHIEVRFGGEKVPYIASDQLMIIYEKNSYRSQNAPLFAIPAPITTVSPKAAFGWSQTAR